MSRNAFFSQSANASVNQIYRLLSRDYPHSQSDGPQPTLKEFIQSPCSDAEYDSVKKSLLQLGAVLFFIGEQDFCFECYRVVQKENSKIISFVALNNLAPKMEFSDPGNFLKSASKVQCRQDEDGFELLAVMDVRENQEACFFAMLLRICILPDSAILSCVREGEENRDFWMRKKQALISFLFSHDDFMRWFRVSSDESIRNILVQRVDPVLGLEFEAIAAEYCVFCRDAGLHLIKRYLGELQHFLEMMRLNTAVRIPLGFYSVASVLHDLCFEMLTDLASRKSQTVREMISFISQLDTYFQDVASWSMLSEAGIYLESWNASLDKLKKSLELMSKFAVIDSRIQAELRSEINFKNRELKTGEPECFSNESLCEAMIQWFVMRDPQKHDNFSKNQVLIHKMLSGLRVTSESSAATVNEVTRSIVVLANMAMRQPSALFSWGFSAMASSVVPAPAAVAREGWHMNWSRDESSAAPFSMLPRGGLTYFLEEREAYLADERRSSKEMGALFNELFEGYCASRDDTAHHNTVIKHFLTQIAEQVMHERYLTCCLHNRCLPDAEWKNHIAVRSRIESVVDYFFERRVQSSDFIQKIKVIVDADSQKPLCEERAAVLSPAL